MIRIEHVNLGWLHKPPLPPACCHCLLVHADQRVVLVDTGIGMHDVANPEHRIGPDAIDAAGFKFLSSVTAIRQLESRAIPFSSVTDIVLTHCDSDHVGGLADFPQAKVHVSSEEKHNLDSGNPRYTPNQFVHGPKWVAYSENDCDTLGLPSRRVATEADIDIRLVPLFGHTAGHCGVAIHDEGRWILHVGDAYYLRDELDNETHPISELAKMRADDDERRRQSLASLRSLVSKADQNLIYFGYHDVTELPGSVPRLEDVA